MKVCELIEKLQQMDPNAEVYIFCNAETYNIGEVEDVSCKELASSRVEIGTW
jgi:hypothetical protein